ncbi:MAG: DUF3530 family protein [Burkholderiales bacterium]|nr:DUF3530 family protein [Burkholderiales bacterium]
MKARALLATVVLAAAMRVAATPLDVHLVLDSTAYGPPPSGGETFSGILREGAGAPAVGVILLHGRGLHPDSHVVGPLRASLNGLGYTTLSIALPVPADTDGHPGATDFQDYVNDASGPNYAFPELYARVRAAEDHLDSLGVERVVLIGFSLGSRMGAAYMARAASASMLPVIAFAGVGMGTGSIDPLDAAATLDEVAVPVLDLYGSLDLSEGVVAGAAARAAAYGSFPSPGPSYTRIVVPQSGAPLDNDAHQFDNLHGTPESEVNQTRMLLDVGNWVSEHAPLPVPEPGSVPLLALGLAAWLTAGGLRRARPAQN